MRSVVSLRILSAASLAAILSGSPALAAVDFSTGGFAAQGEIRVEPRVQPATLESKTEGAKAGRGRARSVHATTVPLGPPPTGAMTTAPESHGKPGTPLQIGFGRDVPALATEDAAVAFLSYEPQADGSTVLAASINSPGAAAMRLGLRVRKLPAGVVLRFYSPDEAMLFELTGEQILETRSRSTARRARRPQCADLLVPAIEGDTVVIEAELPRARLSDLRVSVPRVSHLVASARTGFTPVKSMAAKSASACENDASCQTAAWGSQMNSVARMVFNVGSDSFLCTGTLIADSTPATSVPYFLSAHHCISTQTVASSLDLLVLPLDRL
jgi:hypothetical protein